MLFRSDGMDIDRVTKARSSRQPDGGCWPGARIFRTVSELGKTILEILSQGHCTILRCLCHLNVFQFSIAARAAGNMLAMMASRLRLDAGISLYRGKRRQSLCEAARGWVAGATGRYVVGGEDRELSVQDAESLRRLSECREASLYIKP